MKIQFDRAIRLLGIFTVSVFCASNTSENILEAHRYLTDMGVRNGISLIRNAAKEDDEFDVDMDEYLRLFDEFESVRPSDGARAKYPLFSFRDAIELLKGKLIAETVRVKRQIVPCVAGERSIVLGEEGTLHPCELLHKSYSNVRDFDSNPIALLDSDKGREVRRGIANKECHCTWEILTALSTIYYPRVYTRAIAHRLSRALRRKR